MKIKRRSRDTGRRKGTKSKNEDKEEKQRYRQMKRQKTKSKNEDKEEKQGYVWRRKKKRKRTNLWMEKMRREEKLKKEIKN